MCVARTLVCLFIARVVLKLVFAFYKHLVALGAPAYLAVLGTVPGSTYASPAHQNTNRRRPATENKTKGTQLCNSSNHHDAHAVKHAGAKAKQRHVSKCTLNPGPFDTDWSEVCTTWALLPLGRFAGGST